MNKAFIQKITTYIPEFILFLVFGLIQISHINIDFWNDEIYTIQHFVLTSLINTVSDYHVPNNHVFFNLINNIYLKIIGIDALDTLFDHPWKLRIVPFMYSIITAYFTYRMGIKFVNRTVGLLALALLISTLPYYHFSLQIRGYGLSIMLGVTLVYYLISYFNHRKLKELVKIGFLACFLFYTIPSNLYFLLSIIFAVGVYMMFDKRNISGLLSNKYSISVYAISTGILMAVLLYFPVVNEVFTNQYVKLGNHFNFPILKSSVYQVGYGLINNRLIIILLAIAGFFNGRKFLMKNHIILWLSFSVIIVPILIIWVTGQKAPPRIFTLCLPFVSLFMAMSIFAGWNKYFLLNRKKDWIVVCGVLLIAMISFFHQLNNVEKKLIVDIKEGNRTQDLYYQYYSARYWPLKDMISFKSIYIKNELPVVVVGCEPHGIPHYLEKFNIPYYPHKDFDSLLYQNNSIYVITNHPFKFDERIDIDAKILNPELSYHNQLIIRKK